MMTKSKKITNPQIIGSCFFCDKSVRNETIFCSKEDFEAFQRIFGYIPEKSCGKIGNKLVCESCKNDINSIIDNIESY